MDQPVLDRHSHELFERFGDGPQTGTIDGMAALEAVLPGQFVKMNLASWPDPATNARGGPRLLQVLGVTRGAAGPVLSYLDAGPDFVPLTAPVVAIVRNGADPLHAVDVTITGVPSGATVALDIGYGASAPSVWPVKITQLNLTAITIPANPANTKIWARAQIRLPNRVSSPWSALASVTLNTLAAPSVVAVVSGTTVTITITPGDATLAIMPVTDRLASGTFHDFLAVALPANSVRFVFSGLDAATRYLVGAQHLDRYGGRSAVGYADITTGGAVTLNAPRHMHFRQARGLREEDPVTDVMIGWGFEVSFRPAEMQSSHLVQLATDAAFTNVVQEITAAPGATDSILFFLPRDTNTTYYVRARATRTGYVDSAWSAIISAKPTALMRNPGPDFFAAGSAELSVNATRQVVIAIDNEGDPDTDAAYYEVVVVDPAIVNVDDPASYPTVDQTDNVVLASAMPFIGLALISGSPVTLPVAKYALATVRFWSNVGGWGQTTLLKFPTRVGAIIPIVYSQRSQAANVATVALVVDDPQGRLLDLRYKSVTGGGDHDFRDPTDGTWEEAPYTLI